MKVAQQPAYVLHTRPYLETSLVVELFSADYGRLAVVAKGARRPKQRVASLQPFSALLVSWVGRGPLFTLTGAEATPVAALNEGPSDRLGSTTLSGDYLAGGFYMNELLMRMLEPLDVHTRLFSQYAATLARLAQAQPMSVELRHFEHRLLTECGYVPDFLRSMTQEPIEPQACYELVPEVGFSLLTATQTAKVQGYAGATLLAIAKGDYRVRQTRSAALEIFRIALRAHLGNKPLVSREMLIKRDAP